MKEKLSIIVPCYNEEAVLPAFYKEMTAVADNCSNYEFELLFVNDGSRDETQNIVESFAKNDARIKYISFSRNFGKEAAMLAGLENCTGDYVGFIDADLQHSPDLIPEMLKAVDEEGYDVAACRRVDRKGEQKFKSMLSASFYKVVNKISETYIDDGAQDYRIMNRNVVDSILAMKENIRFTKGIFSWVGFNTKWFPHENRERAAGDTKTPMRVGIIVNIINIVLNFLLIYPTSTYFGITVFGAGLGVIGAAIASSIAFTIGGILITLETYRHPLVSFKGLSLKS